MKKYIGFFSAIAIAALAGSCSKEAPFDVEDTQVGYLSPDALNVEVKNEEILVRADIDTPDVNDFTVEIIKAGESEPALTYLYSKLPEIITLPVGDYTARAVYGSNPDAEFNAPYFKGETETFSIEPAKITSDISPIVCKLSNVKVTVFFHESLASVMSADSKVSVKVGESGSLDFTAADAGRSGYFAYVEDSHTLAATFEGDVENYRTVETKAYTNVAPGTHYRLTFSLRNPGEGDPGNINTDLKIDATVESVDINGEVDAPEDDVLVDDMRPVEGGDEPGPGPTPPVSGDGPTIDIVPPFTLDAVNDVTNFVYDESDLENSDRLILNVHSDSGITGFIVEIDSPMLTDGVLGEFDLSTRMDLVNPASAKMEEGLSNLGLPCKDQVKGQKDVPFEISKFMGVLSLLGSGEHAFTLTVTDANGTTVKTLRIKN